MILKYYFKGKGIKIKQIEEQIFLFKKQWSLFSDTTLITHEVM